MPRSYLTIIITLVLIPGVSSAAPVGPMMARTTRSASMRAGKVFRLGSARAKATALAITTHCAWLSHQKNQQHRRSLNTLDSEEYYALMRLRGGQLGTALKGSHVLKMSAPRALPLGRTARSDWACGGKSKSKETKPFVCDDSEAYYSLMRLRGGMVKSHISNK